MFTYIHLNFSIILYRYMRLTNINITYMKDYRWWLMVINLFICIMELLCAHWWWWRWTVCRKTDNFLLHYGIYVYNIFMLHRSLLIKCFVETRIFRIMRKNSHSIVYYDKWCAKYDEAVLIFKKLKDINEEIWQINNYLWIKVQWIIKMGGVSSILNRKCCINKVIVIKCNDQLIKQ